MDTVIAWAEVELRLGRSATVVETVRPLVAEYPLTDALTAVLMRALHAGGRTAEALDCYARTRKRLSDELGADPELQELHQAMLRGEPDPATTHPTVPPASASVPLPA